MAIGGAGVVRKRKNDLTGRKIGRLKILEPIAGGGKWLCECECGKQIIKPAGNILPNNHNSCSKKCYEKFMASKEIGKRYGRLTIIALNEVKKSRRYFECLCDCGKKSIISQNCLHNGTTKSCGCLHIETSAKLGKLLPHEKGPANPAWRHGKTPEEKLIRRSIPYKIWQGKIKERFEYTCQKCLIKTYDKFQCHHMLNFSEHPNLRFDVDNGILFCRDCHTKFHKIYGTKHNTVSQVEEFIGERINIGNHLK